MRHVPLALKMCKPLKGSTLNPDLGIQDLPRIVFENIHERDWKISQNPVAAAEVFDVTIKAFFSIIMGIPLHLLRGRKSIFTRLLASKNDEFVGAFGKINAIYGVIEAQGSGGLHVHFHAWGQLDHRRMGRFLHDPKFQKHVIDFIDKIVTAEIPDELLDTNESQKKTIIAAEPYPDESSYRLDAGKCRLKIQHHKQCYMLETPQAAEMSYVHEKTTSFRNIYRTFTSC